MSSHEVGQLQNRIDVVSCCVHTVVSATSRFHKRTLKRTVERDMPGSGTSIITKVPADLPDAFYGLHQPHGLVVAEIGYEELISGRMWNHLVGVG